MAKPFIPRSVEEITPDWLTTALTGSGALKDATVRTIKTEPIGSEQGYMGILARLFVEYDSPSETAPSTLIVKMPTQEVKNKITGEIFLHFERENRVYEQVLDKLPLRTPRCYFSAMDSGVGERMINLSYFFYNKLSKGLLNLFLGLFAIYTLMQKRRYILLLEDFGDLEYIDQRDGCSFEDAKLVVKSLGAAQAVFWENPQIEQYWLKPHAEISGLMRLLYERGLPVVRRNFGEQMNRKENEIFDWLLENNDRVDDYIRTRPTTFVHSDYRIDNIFFDREKGEIAVIDWQTGYRGLGVADPAYFCLHGGSGPFTPDQMEELMGFYHQGLVEGGVSGYSLEDCLSDYKYGLMVAIRYVMIILGALEIDNDPNAKALLELWLHRMRPIVESIDTTDYF